MLVDDPFTKTVFGGGGGEKTRKEKYVYFPILEQIAETKAEPQQIVAQRPLSCLQYLVTNLSRLQRI